MEIHIDILIMVEAIMELTIGDELLMNFSFLKCTTARNKREEQGLLKDVLKGKKSKNNQ